MNIGSSPKLLRTRTISEKHVIERHLSDNWHIKTCLIQSANGYVISHERGIYHFPVFLQGRA